MPYATTVDAIDFTFRFEEQLAEVAAPTSYVRASTVKEACREAEASEEGIVYGGIISASGREVFFEEGGDVIANALTVVLQSNWLIDTQLAGGYFIVSDGNVLQANQTPRIQIFADNPLVNTINNTTQFGTISRVSVGSGVTPSDVTAIGAEVESRILSDGTAFAGANVDAPVSDVQTTVDAIAAAVARQLLLSGFTPGSPLTLTRDGQGRITTVEAGGETVNVTHGASSETWETDP